ncbi:MAG TPA: hypothetical protein VL337_02950, partial [Acidimicrobiales bacterium]|nr:hypothetical protein [Acidimicrobiales bacterium]
MRMRFGPNDEKGFHSAQAALLARFDRWLQEDGGMPAGEAPERAGDAALRSDDVADFLLDWCPRTLSVSPADCLPIPEAVGAFMAFLQASGLLAPGSSPLAELVQVAEALTDEFVDAMGDSSNSGMAKSLFGAAAAENVDLTDPDARRRRGRRVPGRRSHPRVVRRLAEFVGDGRKLTQTGNLTLADARALVDLLETGDVVDQRIGSRTFTTRSAAELRRLSLVFTWAKKAGVLRVTHGRVIATKCGAAVAADPGASFDRAVGALLAMGALSAQRRPDWWPEVNQLLDYVVQGPLPIDDLADVAAAAVLDAFSFPRWDDASVARMIGHDVVDMVDVFELAGVVRRAGTEDPEDPTLSPRRVGG